MTTHDPARIAKRRSVRRRKAAKYWLAFGIIVLTVALAAYLSEPVAAVVSLVARALIWTSGVLGIVSSIYLLWFAWDRRERPAKPPTPDRDSGNGQ